MLQFGYNTGVINAPKKVTNFILFTINKLYEIQRHKSKTIFKPFLKKGITLPRKVEHRQNSSRTNKT
jgi:hypothetical protein